MERVTESLQNYLGAYDLGIEFFGNTVGEYILAFIIFIGLAVVFKLIQWVTLRKLAKLAEKTETDIDDTLIRIIQSLKPGFYLFVAFFFCVTIACFYSHRHKGT